MNAAPPLKLWLTRHGATDWSREDRFCGRSDVPLSAPGHAQAAQLAARFAQTPLAAVLASPLRRSQQTAAPLAAALGLEVTVAADLRELDFGAWEGQTRQAIVAADPHGYAAWERDPAAHPPQGGEDPQRAAERIAALLAALAAAHPGGALLAVGHNTLNRLALCGLLGVPLAAYRARFQQAPACVNQLLVWPDRTGRAVTLNDLSHLSDAPEKGGAGARQIS